MAVLAGDFDSIGDFAMNIAVAVAIAGPVTVSTLHADFGMDRHHVNSFTRIGADIDKFAFAVLSPLLWIERINNISLGIQQVAFAIPL